MIPLISWGMSYPQIVYKSSHVRQKDDQTSRASRGKNIMMINTLNIPGLNFLLIAVKE